MDFNVLLTAQGLLKTFKHRYKSKYITLLIYKTIPKPHLSTQSKHKHGTFHNRIERSQRERERERERETEGEGERERDRETETDRQRDRQTETDRETDRQTETERER